MNIQPAGIVENQFQAYEQQINEITTKIEAQFYEEFERSLLERVSGEPEDQARWAVVKLELHALFEKRRVLRIKQRALRRHSVDEPEIQAYIQSLFSLYEGMAATYRDDEQTPE